MKSFGPKKIQILRGQMRSAMKVPFSDFIQNMSQAPTMCLSNWIKVDKYDYLKNP